MNSLSSISLNAGSGRLRWCAWLLMAVLNLPLQPSLQAQNAAAFSHTTNQSAVTITGYLGDGGSVVIPAAINGHVVTGIGDQAFQGKTDITQVTIPEGVTWIGNDAFAGDANLSRMELPASLLWIGGAAFSGCSNLVRLTVPDGVTDIGWFAFAGCSRLTEVTLGRAVKWLNYGLFSDCVSLRELVIPDSVQDVAAMLSGHETPVFRNCRELRQVHLGRGLSGVRWGWNDLFRTCPNLTTVSVAEDHPVYRSIEGVLFSRNATNLVFVPRGRTGRYEVPPGVLSVGYAAFGYCQDLEEVILPDSLILIGDSAFMGCARLREIRLPDSVAGLAGYAFVGCAGLTQITVPNRVTYLGSWTFGGCSSLSRITIPSSVTYVEGMAFADCPSLISVRFLGNPPSRPEQYPLFGGFDGPLDTMVLYLPGTAGWGATFGGVPTAPWLPVIGRPEFAADQPLGAFGFPVEWAPQHQVVVEACSDLAHPDWQPAGTLTLDAEGIARFSDPDSASHPTRTYRLRPP